MTAFCIRHRQYTLADTCETLGNQAPALHSHSRLMLTEQHGTWNHPCYLNFFNIFCEHM